MNETFEINERNQVVPYTAGRKCTDTRAWRDATELELQQQEQISQLERELAEARAQIEANHEATLAIERMVYDARAQRDRMAEALRELCETLLKDKPRDITELLNKAGDALAAVKGGSDE